MVVFKYTLEMYKRMAYKRTHNIQSHKRTRELMVLTVKFSNVCWQKYKKYINERTIDCLNAMKVNRIDQIK